MPTELFGLIPLPPLLAAFIVGGGILFGSIRGEAGERLTGRLAMSGTGLSLLLIVTALILKGTAGFADQKILGLWLQSGDYHVYVSYRLDYLGLSMAALVATLGLFTLRFSIDYMHREAGYHRFFLVMSLFIGAMLVLVTAGNAVLTFIGWELAGVCSYLLIAYAYDRQNAAANATRAFVSNRVGDAGFILGLFLSQIWVGSLEWDTLAGGMAHLERWQIGVIGCCFILAAMAKSAQIPFAPWLAKAIEGPTPSSAIFYGAIMVHAGVFLLLRLEPVLSLSPSAMNIMIGIGAMTAFYGWFCGFSQTDVKSALIFSTSTQLGLMFVEAGLGWWQLAWWHLMAHAGMRGYQFLTAPSLMHQVIGLPARPVPAVIGRCRLLYLASLQRLWLEPLFDRLTSQPLHQIGADLQALETQLIEPAFGLPASQRLDVGAQRDGRDVLQASGISGSLTLTMANWLHWFEEKLVLQGLGQHMLNTGRRLGSRLNRLEALLNQPRYLVALIVATLMLVF